MKKILFTLLLCVFAVLGANAALVVSGPDNGLVTIEYDGDGDFKLSSYKNQILNGTNVEL
jgi:hypothetical protein